LAVEETYLNEEETPFGEAEEEFHYPQVAEVSACGYVGLLST